MLLVANDGFRLEHVRIAWARPARRTRNESQALFLREAGDPTQ